MNKTDLGFFFFPTFCQASNSLKNKTEVAMKEGAWHGMRCQEAVVAVLGPGEGTGSGIPEQQVPCQLWHTGWEWPQLCCSLFGLQHEAFVHNYMESIYFLTHGAVPLSWEFRGWAERPGHGQGGHSALIPLSYCPEPRVPDLPRVPPGSPQGPLSWLGWIPHQGWKLRLGMELQSGSERMAESSTPRQEHQKIL